MGAYVTSQGALSISSGQCPRAANHPEGVFLGEALSLQRIEGPLLSLRGKKLESVWLFPNFLFP